MKSHLSIFSILLLSCTLLFSAASTAKTVTGMEVADSISLGDSTLLLNGAGARTKVVIKVYVSGLYLEQKSNDAAAIVAADEPMAIRLYVTSNMLNAKRMKKALLTGFDKSTGGDTAPVQSGIDQLLDLMSGKIGKNAVYTLNYRPGAGTDVYNGDKLLDTVEGLPFKQALFGIWLSDKPAQASLKNDMLGK